MEVRENRSTVRAWFDVVLSALILVVAIGYGADLLLHRGDPFVWGSFVRTSEPCSGKGCVTIGDWVADGTSVVHHGAILDGGVDDDGRTRAAYRGSLPIPTQEPPAVATPGWLRVEPWLPAVGIPVVGAFFISDIRRLRRRRGPDRPASRNRPGAHRPAHTGRREPAAPVGVPRRQAHS